MSELLFDPKVINILVVDDHDLIRKSIEKILKKKNFHNFLESSNGVEAINLLKTNEIDLVFCDLYMPKADGFEVLSFLRNRSTRHDIPFIVVTGEANKNDIVKAVDMGAEDYLLKPFQTLELEKKTLQVLNTYFSPDPLLAHIRAAEQAYLTDHLEAAGEAVSKALKLSPESARARHLKAMIFEKRGEIGDAIKVLRENISLNPSYLKNYKSLADLYLKLGQTQEAIVNMQAELSLNPKNIRRQVQVAKLLHKSGDFHGAIEHCRQALLENTKMKQALMAMGQAYAEMDNLEKAVYYFKRLRRCAPDQPQSLEAVVKYSLAAKKPKVAEIILRDEKKNFPKRLDTYQVMAKFYTATDQIEEAQAVIHEALTKSPENKESLQIAISLAMRVKDLDLAEKYIRLMQQHHPSYTNQIRLAHVYLEKEQYAKATHLLHQCLTVPAAKPQAYAAIGAAAGKTKQLLKAYFAYQRALNYGSDKESLEALIKKVEEVIKHRRIPRQNKAS